MNGNLFKWYVSKVCVKQIRFNQEVGLQFHETLSLTFNPKTLKKYLVDECELDILWSHFAVVDQSKPKTESQ